MFPQQTAQRIRQAITAAVTYVFHHPKPAAAHQTQFAVACVRGIKDGASAGILI
jgi:hypothetical protein